jgi:F-type H+-transporting ATPase subunit delta
MGSATREALAASRAALSATGGVTLAVAEELFSAARVIGSSTQLRAILADPSTPATDKQGLIESIFGARLDAKSKKIVDVAVTQRWSSQDDLLSGIEELGLRAAATSAPAGTSIESELFDFGLAVSSDPELELAVGNKRAPDEAKIAMLDSLLGTKVSPQTLAIVRQLVLQPRGRRIGQLLSTAADVVADQSGQAVAKVTSAVPIAPAQLTRLQQGLASSYGREITLNLVVDPSIIGGLRVQVGDDVIDGTVARKLADLRLQLAG